MTKQGRPVFGVELKIVDDTAQAQPHDGKSLGELLVRGPWIVSGYFEDAEASAAAVEQDGWFHTGDVATIDPDGYMQIVDRRKGRDQIRRRVDQLDRSRKCRCRPCRRGRSRGDRRAPIRAGASGRC